MNDKEKKYKNAKVTLLIKLLITIKMLKIFFIMHQKLIKKSKSKIEKSIAERMKLRRQKLKIIAKKKKKKKKKLF